MTIQKFGAFVPISREMLGPSVGCRISSDPKGPVNKIVRLIVSDGTRQRQVKAALVGRHVLVGAKVAVERVDTPTTTPWDDHWQPVWKVFGRYGYRVTVDGREALYASDAEIWPAPKPIPVGALKSAQNRVQAAFRWLLAQPRAATDRLARRLGYHRADECGVWDE